MSRLSKFVAFFGIVAIGLICAGIGHGQDYETTMDWKDIYILPTNPNPQNNIKITLSAERQPLKPGDELNLTFTADRECYLTLMDMGTSGKILRIWPNDYSGQDNRIDANSPRKFPGSGDKFKFRIAGPDGTERLIAYATSEKGKILSEQEFEQLKKTGFKKYPGSAKDLAIQFQKRTESIGSNISWGTAQLNVPIGSGPPPSVESPRPSRIFLLSVSGHGRHDNRPEDNSAQRIAATLQSKAGIKKSDVRVLKDADADYRGFSSGIQWLASSAQPEDTVVIYFTGHGGNLRGEGFLVLYPGQQKNLNLQDHFRRKIFLIKNEFGSLIKKIPARKKILIVDSCHARAITKDFRTDDDELMSNYLPLTDFGEEEWTMVDKGGPPSYGNDHEALLAACRRHETSFSNKFLKGAVFSYFLEEAIKRGCCNLEDAFSLAKKNAAIWYRKGGNRNPPEPCLVDPHGLTREFRFKN